MTNCSLLFYTTVCFITTWLSNSVQANVKEFKSFQTTCSTRALESKSTLDVDSVSMIECALLCLSSRQCCLASFSGEKSTCRIDKSEKCEIGTETINGWKTIRRDIYRKFECLNGFII